MTVPGRPPARPGRQRSDGQREGGSRGLPPRTATAAVVEASTAPGLAWESRSAARAPRPRRRRSRPRPSGRSGRRPPEGSGGQGAYQKDRADEHRLVVGPERFDSEVHHWPWEPVDEEVAHRADQRRGVGERSGHQLAHTEGEAPAATPAAASRLRAAEAASPIRRPSEVSGSRARPHGRVIPARREQRHAVTVPRRLRSPPEPSLRPAYIFRPACAAGRTRRRRREGRVDTEGRAQMGGQPKRAK